jgi:hypothetical protein
MLIEIQFWMYGIEIERLSYLIIQIDVRSKIYLTRITI